MLYCAPCRFVHAVHQHTRIHTLWHICQCEQTMIRKFTIMRSGWKECANGIVLEMAESENAHHRIHWKIFNKNEIELIGCTSTFCVNAFLNTRTMMFEKKYGKKTSKIRIRMCYLLDFHCFRDYTGADTSAQINENLNKVERKKQIRQSSCYFEVSTFSLIDYIFVYILICDWDSVQIKQPFRSRQPKKKLFQ